MPESIQQAHRDLQIAEQALAGTTYTQIAKHFNLTQGRISQILSKPQIREVVNQGTNHLISLIPLAIDNYLNILSNPEHTDFYKANKDILQNTGILASHAGGCTYVQNIFNATQATDIVDVNRFAGMITKRQDADVVEAEYLSLIHI